MSQKYRLIGTGKVLPIKHYTELHEQVASVDVNMILNSQEDMYNPKITEPDNFVF